MDKKYLAVLFRSVNHSRVYHSCLLSINPYLLFERALGKLDNKYLLKVNLVKHERKERDRDKEDEEHTSGSITCICVFSTQIKRDSEI